MTFISAWRIEFANNTCDEVMIAINFFINKLYLLYYSWLSILAWF